MFIVQLTTSRIDNLTQLIHTLAICDDNTYIKLMSKSGPWSQGINRKTPSSGGETYKVQGTLRTKRKRQWCMASSLEKSDISKKKQKRNKKDDADC